MYDLLSAGGYVIVAFGGSGLAHLQLPTDYDGNPIAYECKVKTIQSMLIRLLL